MAAVRRRIPTSIERQVLTETGHRCAVCGEPSPLERAHIIAWHTSKSHSAEDLICLCANCHRRADNERWGEKTLRVYKQNPWVIRSRSVVSNCPPRRAVTLRIDLPFDLFDDDTQHILVYALAAFLKISPDDVEIVEMEPGSTLITIKLPPRAARALLRAVLHDDPRYLAAIGCVNRLATEKPSPVQIARLNQASNRVKAPAVIKVVGLGGGGCRAIRHIMRTRQVGGVEYIAVNTDVRSLGSVEGALPIQIGEYVTHGFGAGGDPRVGSSAADESEQLKRALEDTKMVFIAVGMGGGTGTGAAPVVARIAKNLGAMVFAVVTMPFSFEGKKRSEVAWAGIQELATVVDNMTVIHNDKLLDYAEHDTDVSEAFNMVDDVLAESIMIIPRLVARGSIDMADVDTIMGVPGATFMAMGQGKGSHPAMDAAEQALSKPLVDVKMTAPKGLILIVSGGPDLTLTEVTEVGTLLISACDSKCHFRFVLGTLSEELRGRAKVTLIATGIEGSNPAYATTRTASSHRVSTVGIASDSDHTRISLTL